MKTLLLFFLVALSGLAQTNLGTPTNSSYANSNLSFVTFLSQTNQDLPPGLQVEQMRTACLSGRRSICGKILKILPAGLVVDCGYTNLMRPPLTRSWLAPSSVSASRAVNFVEGNEPNSICSGLVFLTELPKSRSTKPKIYDYVLIEGYPAGQYSYTSVGNIKRTVRRFSTSLDAAVKLKIKYLKNKDTP